MSTPRFRRGIIERAAEKDAQRASNGPPKCRPCRDGVHKNCPTAITKHTTGDFVSDYECPCYYADPDGHRDLVEENDADHDEAAYFDREERWDSQGGFLHGF